MITECSNCKYYKTDFREEPCKSCISYRYFVSLEEAKKEETIRAEAIKEFVERLEKKLFPYGMPDNGNYGINAKAVKAACEKTVKEMVGE